MADKPPPGFLPNPSLSDKWMSLLRWVFARLKAWRFTRHVLIVLAVAVPGYLLTWLLPSLTIPLYVSILAVLVWQFRQAYRKRLQAVIPLNQGEEMSEPSSPHANAHRLTLLSGALGNTEVVKSDRPQHWIAAFVVLFQRSSLIALGVLIGCLLTPWSSGIFVLLKLVAMTAVSYWLMYQEAPVIWTRRVVTDKFVRIIYQPWRIFGAEAGWSMKVATLNTVDYRRSMWTRVLHLDCATVMLDGPGDKDEKFNRMLWVSHWKEFVDAASMDGKALFQRPSLRQKLFKRP